MGYGRFTPDHKRQLNLDLVSCSRYVLYIEPTYTVIIIDPSLESSVASGQRFVVWGGLPRQLPRQSLYEDIRDMK